MGLVALFHCVGFSLVILFPSPWILSRVLLETFNPILFYNWITILTMPGHEKSLIGRFFRWQPMRFLGYISMPFYMVHMLVAQAIAMAVGAHPGEDSDDPRFPIQPWMWAIALATSLFLGWFITICFEKPIAKLIRNDHHTAADKLEQQQEQESHAPSPVVMGETEV